jgi:hypothetical protein
MITTALPASAPVLSASSQRVAHHVHLRDPAARFGGQRVVRHQPAGQHHRAGQRPGLPGERLLDHGAVAGDVEQPVAEGQLDVLGAQPVRQRQPGAVLGALTVPEVADAYCRLALRMACLPQAGDSQPEPAARARRTTKAKPQPKPTTRRG